MNYETRNRPKEIIFTSLWMLLFPESIKTLAPILCTLSGERAVLLAPRRKSSYSISRNKSRRNNYDKKKKKKHRSTPYLCRKRFKFRTCAVQLFVTIDPALFHISSKPSQIPFINHNGEFRCGMTLNRKMSQTVPLYAMHRLSLRL